MIIKRLLVLLLVPCMLCVLFIPNSSGENAITSENPRIIGTWRCTGLVINDVKFDLPNYKLNLLLSVYSNGAAALIADGEREEGQWIRDNEKLTLYMKSSGTLSGIITEHNISLPMYGMELLFSNNKTPEVIIPEKIEAMDEDEFVGRWRISRVLCSNCSQTPYQLSNVGFDNSLVIDISAETVMITFSGGREDGILYNKMFVDGCLYLTNSGRGTSIKVMLSDTGELYFIVTESFKQYMVCLVRDDNIINDLREDV